MESFTRGWRDWLLLLHVNAFVALILGLAILGGTVRGVQCPQENFTLWGFLQRVLAAAFVGTIAWLLSSHFGFSGYLQGAVVGAAGYSGIDLLKCFTPWLKRQLRLGERK